MPKKQLSRSSDSTQARSGKTSFSSSLEHAPRRPNSRFPATARVKKRDEFKRVFEDGQVATDDVLVVHALRVPGSTLRIGISVSKKVGTAPLRNRWKRLIREAFRLQRPKLPTALLIVVRPRRGARPEFRTIRHSLAKLVQRLDRKL